MSNKQDPPEPSEKPASPPPYSPPPPREDGTTKFEGNEPFGAPPEGERDA